MKIDFAPFTAPGCFDIWALGSDRKLVQLITYYSTFHKITVYIDLEIETGNTKIHLSVHIVYLYRYSFLVQGVQNQMRRAK
jgi:hypothetical protein